MRRSSTFSAILCIAATLAGVTHASDGQLDLGFGEVPGYTAFGISGPNTISVPATATTRFDRTWVFIEGDAYGTQLHVGRIISSSGLLDTGFGPDQDGRKSVNMPAGLSGPAPMGAIAQNDGIPVVFGRLRGTIDGDYPGFVCRFANAGNLHAAFGTNGCTVIRSMVPGNESLQVTAATQDNFGRIVIAGTYEVTGQNQAHRFLARLGTNGLYDPEFAGGLGFITLPQLMGDGHVQYPVAVRVDAFGRILMLSTISNNMSTNDLDILLQRFDDGGGLDPEFANAGTRLVSFNQDNKDHDAARDMVLLPDGRIVVLALRAEWENSLVLMRFNADATQYDPAFNGGAPRFDLPLPHLLTPSLGPLAIDDLGRTYIVVDGGTIQSRRTEVMRHRPDGSLDPDFGSGGRSQISGQEMTGDPTLNAGNCIGATIVGRDQLLVTATLIDEDANNNRAFNYSLEAGSLFRDGFE